MDVDKVPDGPPEEINPPAMRARAAFHELLDLMTQLFTIRPVWIRRALYDGIPARLQGPFKKVISKVAYSFQENGPFYMAWIRYGYDPRKDPSSRKFQVMEIRITNVIIQAAVLERLGEGKNADPHTTSPLGKSGGAPPRETGEVGGTQYPEPFHMPAKFTLAQLPRKRNNFVQICDISLDNIVKLCRDEPVTDTFDPKYGFFSKQGHERLSSTIKRTLLEMSKHELGEDRVTQLQKGDYSSIGQGTGRRPIRLFLKDVIKPPQGAQLPGTPTVVSEVPTSRLSNVVEPGPDRAQVISGQVQNHTPVQEVALQMTNQITPQVALQPLPVQAVDRVADLNVGSDAANQQTPEMTSEALDMEDAEGIQILEDDDDDDDEYYDDSDEDI